MLFVVLFFSHFRIVLFLYDAKMCCDRIVSYGFVFVVDIISFINASLIIVLATEINPSFSFTSCRVNDISNHNMLSNSSMLHNLVMSCGPVPRW